MGRKPCRFKSEYGLFVVVANMLHIYGLLLLYRFYLEEEEALPLAFQRCTYFFCGKHLHRTKKPKKQNTHVTMPYRFEYTPAACTHQYQNKTPAPAQKNALTSRTHTPEQTNKQKCTHHKKKCTLQHQYARTWWRCAVCACVYVCAACTHPAPTERKCTHQHRTHRPEKNIHAHAPKENVRTSMYTPAPAYK